MKTPNLKGKYLTFFLQCKEYLEGSSPDKNKIAWCKYFKKGITEIPSVLLNSDAKKCISEVLNLVQFFKQRRMVFWQKEGF